MPKKKKLYVNMPKLIQYEAIDHMMFGYVLGMQKALPATFIRKSIELFLSDFDLTDDQYDLDHAQKTFSRMSHSYREFIQKT